MMTVEERYQRDPGFRTMVDMMRHQIREGRYTPTEIREAAMLAQVLHESETIRPMTLDTINELRKYT